MIALSGVRRYMVTIIGCDHIHQRKGQRCFGDPRLVAFEADQKRRFAEVIADHQELRGATLICEEIERDCDTFARDLAGRQNARYANVDMPVAERARRGIPEGYSALPYPPEQIEGGIPSESNLWSSSFSVSSKIDVNRRYSFVADFIVNLSPRFFAIAMLRLRS